MRNPWGFWHSSKAYVRNAWEAAFGNRLRQFCSALILFFVVLLIYAVEPDDSGLIEPAKLNEAIEISHFFEDRNRDLAADLENERRRRRLAEQTINALASNVRDQDRIILDQNQQITFLRQLLEERGSDRSETAIRTFDIVPDFRPNHYQLSAVLVRSGTESEPFTGKLELALSLVNEDGVAFDHRPVLEPGALDVTFRYYHEAQAVFPIPSGTEILNGQLVLLDSEGNVVVSRTLADQY